MTDSVTELMALERAIQEACAKAMILAARVTDYGHQGMDIHNATVAFDAKAFQTALAAAGLVVERGWQHISSAPMNAYVLVQTAVGNVGEARALDTPRGWEWYWANVHWTDNHAEQIYPIHWRPLPAAQAPRAGAMKPADKVS